MSVLLCLLMFACPEQVTPIVRQFCEQHCLPAQALGCRKNDQTCHKSLSLRLDQVLAELGETAGENPECRTQRKRSALTALTETLVWHRACPQCQEAEGNQPFGAVTLAMRLLRAAADGYQAGHLSEARLAIQLKQIAILLQDEATPAMPEYAAQINEFLRYVEADLKGNG